MHALLIHPGTLGHATNKPVFPGGVQTKCWSALMLVEGHIADVLHALQVLAPCRAYCQDGQGRLSLLVPAAL